MALTPLFSGSLAKNYLLNSNFDFWQRATSGTVATGSSAYAAPDRWYIKNSLGTGGVITCARVAPTLNNSRYGCSVQITTVPTASQANGTEIYQVLENPLSIELLNQNISAAVQIKALGNVNQVGIQFFYATTEAKLTTAMGAEAVISVNTSGFTLGTLLNQFVGMTPTTSGVVGIRIRIVGVSTGNTYDLNNGFILEQATLTVSGAPLAYLRQGASIAQELLLCQRFYEKSYQSSDAPGTASSTYRLGFTGFGTSQRPFHWVPFKVNKRAIPTVTVYDPSTGTSGNVRDENTGLTMAGTIINQAYEYGFNLQPGGTPASGDAMSFHFSADADI